MSTFLASFLAEPLPVADYWLWLALPICLSISVAYKTIKADRFADIFLSSLATFFTMIGGMIAVTIGLWLISRL